MSQEKKSGSTSFYRNRRSFAKIPDVMDVPDLIAVQTESFKWLITEGLAAAFADICPIDSTTKDLSLILEDLKFDDPVCTIEECKQKDMTYQAPLYCQARLIDRTTGELYETKKYRRDGSSHDKGIFMGDFPLMTPRGTFIINGTERVVVSQLVRSPGIYFSAERDKTSDKIFYGAKIIPSRGAWLEFETDKRDILSVRIDRKRKQPATLILRALGLAETNEEIIDLLGDTDMVRRTLDRDPATNQDEALIEIYRRFRPGEPPTVESGRSLLEGLYFNPARYDLARVGRYKANKKLGFDQENDISTLTDEDILETMRYIVALHEGEEGYRIDDIDHFGNRRIRTVGELIQNQFRIGLSRMERVVRERMSSLEPEKMCAENLVNIRPIVAAIKEFFGSSQLSQFMDQSNPAAGITHKRRLSALGPGGLSRERAGFEVRDVHTSHYGRMCPIETPEGPNIGLIGSLATYARINSYGFIEAPYRRVIDGKVTDEVDYLTADEEENFIIAQANESFNQETREFGHFDDEGNFIVATRVLCRMKDADGVFGEPDEVSPELVNYMDVSPRQMVSVATSLIPFLEHDDAKRALMGSNMQRQAVPLLRPSAPLVGTGIEHRIALDSGEVLVAQKSGVVDYVDGQTIIILNDDGEYDEYLVPKFQRSNQSGCMNHKPLVRPGDRVEQGDVLTDGTSCDKAELSLGQNLLVAYMPWEGFNYEDAIVVSERVVSEDLLTSIHISEYEIEARDIKLNLGREEFTREIPNVSERAVANLDEDGIIRIGAEVRKDDILVGKVTPKGETEETSEERVLRAIFGEKAKDVRDTSLKVPHGGGGRVIAVQHFCNQNSIDGKREMRPGVEKTELAPGVNEMVRVFVAQKRKIQQGDKLSGRHGNKGVISKILPVEDMPYMADGTPVDIILNPLGVPSRMNIGQLLECHLGWAAKWGWSDDDPSAVVEGPLHVATPVFDGATEEEISEVIKKANQNLRNTNNHKLGSHARDEFVPQLSETGKTILFDGRTGEPFREPITVGYPYILKLGHMVDDKIHARATGPYSLITQQPLGGKAQFGGQRFGEMEVWALYAYGASNVLQEILTIKSDDVSGRNKTYQAIIKGENIPRPEVPESFKVLMREMKSLCLNVELEDDEDTQEVSVQTEEVEEEIVRFEPEDHTSLQGEVLIDGALGFKKDDLLAGLGVAFDDDDILLGAPASQSQEEEQDSMLIDLMSEAKQVDAEVE